MGEKTISISNDDKLLAPKNASSFCHQLSNMCPTPTETRVILFLGFCTALAKHVMRWLKFPHQNDLKSFPQRKTACQTQQLAPNLRMQISNFTFPTRTAMLR